jgi:hypothetical protein
MRTAGILSHRAHKIKCLDRLSPSTSDRLVVRKAASDFPGFHHQVIYCHACGLTVHIEQKLDSAGQIVSSTVDGASGLNSSWTD